MPIRITLRRTKFPPPKIKTVERRCLKCDDVFLADNAFIRICQNCKSNKAYVEASAYLDRYPIDCFLADDKLFIR